MLLLLLLLQRLRIVERREIGRGKSTHGRNGTVVLSLLKRCPGKLLWHGRHLEPAILSWVRVCGVVAGAGARDHRRGRDGHVGVGHRYGRRSRPILLLDLRHVQLLVGTHCGRIHGGWLVGRALGGPRIGELGGILWEVVLVDTVEAHAAVLAVLVLDHHRHGEGWELRRRGSQRREGRVGVNSKGKKWYN